MVSFSRSQRNKYILPIVLLLLALLIQGASRRALAEGGSDSPDATARPVTINFESQPDQTVIFSQYPTAIFSATGFSQPPGGCGSAAIAVTQERCLFSK